MWQFEEGTWDCNKLTIQKPLDAADIVVVWEET